MSINNNLAILILEDDVDQMALLIDSVLNEIKNIIDDENISLEIRNQIKNTNIIKTTNINALEKAVSLDKTVILAILDCNTPDTDGGNSHDQLIKSNYKITGQHRSVDIVSKSLPNTPITMISSLNRFQKIVTKYYDSKYNLSINFIKKSEPLMIKRNIRYYLRQYLRSQN